MRGGVLLSVNRIDSPENLRVRQIAALLKKRSERAKQGLMVIENPVMLQEALSCGIRVTAAFFDDRCLTERADLVSACEKNGASVFSVSDRVLKKLSALETPQGVSAVIDISTLPEVTLRPDGRYIICERMSDPGNLGTIIRTADAMGFNGVILSQGSVDAFSSKVVRATMGSFFRMPILTDADLSTVLSACKTNGIVSLAAVLDEEAKPAQEIRTERGIAILIGNEAAGLTKETVALCDRTAYIPMTGKTESLNAAVAAAIFMWLFRGNA